MSAKNNISCLDIELAIMHEFDFRQNIIVPNITTLSYILPFETDMLVLTKNGYAYGFEIKISKSDLKADFKKPQHSKINQMHNGKTGLEMYYGKYKYFYYAVPEHLKEYALEIIPEFCGLWVLNKPEYPLMKRFYQVKEPRKLFDYKWSNAHRYEVARLGAMRIYTLKSNISEIINNR
jgi:hypothetical protein